MPTNATTKIARVATVYLSEQEIRLLLDRITFHEDNGGYSDDGYDLGLKLASSLLALSAAPVVGSVISYIDGAPAEEQVCRDA